MDIIKKKYLYIIIAVVVIAIAAGSFWYFKLRKVSTFGSDKTIAGDYTIEQEEKVIIKNGSTLTIEGDLILKGEIICENGPLNIIVKGATLVEGKLECNRGEELTDSGSGISIVVGASFEMAKEAEIVTNGHVQIVDSIDDLAVTEQDFDALYEEAGEDSGEGNRLGPISAETSSISSDWTLSPKEKAKTRALAGLKSFFQIPKAYANPPMITVRGSLTIGTPPKGTRLIIILRASNYGGFIFEDFHLRGPDGNDGDDDEGECTVEGEKGEDALRFFVRAPKILIKSMSLTLGSGGDGGTAVTPINGCKEASATGGAGGRSGNFKMIASGEFSITEYFTIHPGWSGSGGDAFAYGGDGGPNEPGGNATAIGGVAADNKMNLTPIGNVSGTENIEVGFMMGGNGGSAYAFGGHGGDGIPCYNDGARGGDALAEAGKGGDALIVLTGTDAKRTAGAEDIGGDAGVVDAVAGFGGYGSDCDCESGKPGARGGDGGDAEVVIEGGGNGGTRDGKISEVKRIIGGDGGDGGDGDTPGEGGNGGAGLPSGKDGNPGNNLDCEEVPYDPGEQEEEEEGPGEQEEPEPYCGDGNCDEDEGECCESCPEDCEECFGPEISTSVRVHFVCNMSSEVLERWTDYYLEASFVFLDDVSDGSSTFYFIDQIGSTASVGGSCWHDDTEEDYPVYYCKDIRTGELVESLDFIKEYSFPSGFDYGQDDHVFYDDFLEITEAEYPCP